MMNEWSLGNPTLRKKQLPGGLGANEFSPAQASAHATGELCTRGSIMSGAGIGGFVQSDFYTSMICHDMARFSSYPLVIPHLLENEQVFHWQIGKSFIKKQFAISV